jgi:hypothetical protein
VVELVGCAWKRLSKLLVVRSGSDDNQKTLVLCYTYMYDQFSENPRSMVRSLLDVIFFLSCGSIKV